mmetsp:Transcript_12534/g.17122  ORF Transcript_12534/g.17122 Transcript_12534/m.17122 type:complete len:251 (+) Transcript_12534:212-964(+)|eukprot:CAMPEP_0196588186 /NCGR_PEP_ID=MMETSP1081-20130531/59773_1 /TAXON_ID=36882 /ORGANISM="Pyramimonas amylifera, Strain CCMP720" /LENGTH=250 /DNA_ID=CAMNT_0041910611 /DNA_START=210 /DNA_END=962 /DNA_ORIENTATION=-
MAVVAVLAQPEYPWLFVSSSLTQSSGSFGKNGALAKRSKGISKFHRKSRSFACISDLSDLDGCATILEKPQRKIWEYQHKQSAGHIDRSKTMGSGDTAADISTLVQQMPEMLRLSSTEMNTDTEIPSTSDSECDSGSSEIDILSRSDSATSLWNKACVTQPSKCATFDSQDLHFPAPLCDEDPPHFSGVSYKRASIPFPSMLSRCTANVSDCSGVMLHVASGNSPTADFGYSSSDDEFYCHDNYLSRQIA